MHVNTLYVRRSELLTVAFFRFFPQSFFRSLFPPVSFSILSLPLIRSILSWSLTHTLINLVQTQALLFFLLFVKHKCTFTSELGPTSSPHSPIFKQSSSFTPTLSSDTFQGSYSPRGPNSLGHTESKVAKPRLCAIYLPPKKKRPMHA